MLLVNKKRKEAALSLPEIEKKIICEYLWGDDKEKGPILMNLLCKRKEINYAPKYCMLKLTKKLKDGQSGGENKLA